MPYQITQKFKIHITDKNKVQLLAKNFTP